MSDLSKTTLLQKTRVEISLTLFSLSCFALQGCSFPSSSEKARIQVEVQNASQALLPFSSPSATPFGAAPSAVGGFDCLALNVVGPGIPPNDPFFFQKNPFLDPSSHCQYMGAVSPAFPVGPNPTVLELEAPSGPARLIQVVGIDSNIGCPVQPLNEIAGGFEETTNQASFAGVYEIGRTVIDVFSDVSVSIDSSYDSSNPKDLDNCEQSTTSTELAESITGLQLWLRAHDIGASNGADVTSWTDKTGVYTAVTSTNAPNFVAISGTTGLAAVQFDSTNTEGLKIAGTPSVFPTNVAEFTVIVAAKFDDGTSPRFLVGATDTADNYGTSQDYLQIQRAVLKNRVTLHDGAPTTKNVDDNDTLDQTNYHIHVARWSLASGILENIFDGELNTTTTSPISAIGMDGSFNIGNHAGTASASQFFGEIGEILVYSKKLTDTDLQALECYLSAKYSVSLTHSCP